VVAFFLRHVEHLLNHSGGLHCVDIVLKVLLKNGVGVVFLDCE
jgi:hypothetical protein